MSNSMPRLLRSDFCQFNSIILEVETAKAADVFILMDNSSFVFPDNYVLTTKLNSFLRICCFGTVSVEFRLTT